MCPLRFILLFLSAVLAGYFALRTTAEAPPTALTLPDQPPHKTGLLTKASSGFWVMVDMLSGRYLYHNLKGQAQAEAVAED